MSLPVYDPTTALQAEYLGNLRLTTERSAKDTRHISLRVPSALTYAPGDSLGIFPANDPTHVEHLLELTAAEPDDIVETPDGRAVPAYMALSRYYQIAHVPVSVLKKVAEASRAAALLDLCQAEKKEELKQYLEGIDLIDLFHEHPDARMPLTDVLPLLRPLAPRLYSIASSQAAHDDLVHLCVGLVRYDAHGLPHTGVCSGYLTQRLFPGDPVDVFVHENAKFKLPEDDSRDVIMIGPGTGIAPFRGFMEERIARGATGRNWLFFGDQHQASDYLYAEDWQRWQEDGFLHRHDCAWSRDQEQKMYVQHKIREHKEAIWEWFSQGAIIYVCGDAKHMAKDVDTSLRDLIMEYSGCDEDGAKKYLKSSIQDGRYQRDVYSI